MMVRMVRPAQRLVAPYRIWLIALSIAVAGGVAWYRFDALAAVGGQWFGAVAIAGALVVGLGWQRGFMRGATALALLALAASGAGPAAPPTLLVAALLPTVILLVAVPSAVDDLIHDRAVATAGIAVTLTLLALWPVIDGAGRGALIATLVLGGLLLPPPPPTAAAAPDPAWLPPLPDPRRRRTLIAAAAALAVLAIGNGAWLLAPVDRPLPVPWSCVLVLIGYLLFSARLLQALLVAANCGAVLGVLAWVPLPVDTAGLALAVALLAVLAAWRQQDLVPRDQPPAPILATAVIALALAGWRYDPARLVLAPGMVAPGLVAVALVVVAHWPLAPLSALRGGSVPAGLPPLARVGRASVRLGPYFRFFNRAKLRWDPVYAQLVAQPGPWGRVLDAGCGNGLVTGICACREDVTAYDGIDLDRTKLVAARTLCRALGRDLGPRWRLGRADLTQTLEPAAYDTAFLIDVLHYWPADHQRDLLAVLAQALGPGGVLFLREGVADEHGRAGAVEWGERFTTILGINPTGDLHFPTVTALETMLAEAGFVIDRRLGHDGVNRLWRCRRV